MYVESLKKAMAAFGPIFVQLYGQGEAPMTITGLRRGRPPRCRRRGARLGRLRRAPASTSRCSTPTARRSAIGEIGEIVCRGDVVMSGYWRNPRRHRRRRCSDGWLHTGDMGSFDARGYLTLRDRSKDVVISGGSNIYPREVEEVLLEHPGSPRRAWSGAPDEEWGEVVVAFIVGTADRPPSSTRICWSASPGSSGPSATSSSTSCRRTATARCSSASCGNG